MKTQPGRRHSFILRIWQEHAESSEEAPLWRGWIQHIGSGESTYLGGFQDLIAFVKHWAAPGKDKPQSPSD
ncbi:MAG: hypothetical protein D6775_12815 [Caldilineae bacterium]|nr:MAG: hypothetical protein D6775_12815 [Caldilineae bacterium]